MANNSPEIDPVRLNEAIQMLNTYINDNCIKPLISTLEALEKDPANQSLLAQVSDALNSLGVMKGAVVNYAPYVWIMLSEDPFAGK